MKTLFKSITIASAVLLPLLALQAQTRQTPNELSTKTHKQHTMMLLGQLELEEGLYSTHAGDIIYAFIDGECRGTASPMAQHNGLIFLSIGENSEQPKAIELMVWLDERQELLPINETFSFAPLKAEGELNEPVILTLGEMVGTEEAFPAGWHIGDPYPNPSRDKTSLPYMLGDESKFIIRLYNSTGQIVFTGIEQSQAAGRHVYELHKNQLAPGLYLITVEIQAREKMFHAVKRLIVE